MLNEKQQTTHLKTYPERLLARAEKALEQAREALAKAERRTYIIPLAYSQERK